MSLPLARSFRLVAVLLRRWFDPSDHPPALWLQRTALDCALVLGLEIITRGPLPSRGLIVANHLGYLDIIALASVLPCRFVAKKEVSAWPVFGAFASRGSTIYVDRRSRRDVAAANATLGQSLHQPLCTVIFPEGTSSGGREVLPFRSSLLEPAVVSRSFVTPLGISYQLENGDPAADMAYHGDMTLLPHLWNLLRFPKLRITLTFGAPRVAGSDRKAAAADLRDEVAKLVAAHHSFTPACPEAHLAAR